MLLDRAEEKKAGLPIPGVFVACFSLLSAVVLIQSTAAAETPRLDALATESVRFANAYVTQASCSSSRSSID